MDFTQIILLISVSILTIILALVGFEVFLIFREFLQATKKVNRVLDDVGLVSSSITKQVTNLSELIATAKTTFDLAKGFFQKEKHPEENKKEAEEGEIEDSPVEKTKEKTTSPVRRFFTQTGRKIS